MLKYSKNIDFDLNSNICSSALNWTPAARTLRDSSFYVCIIALFLHILCWIQIFLFQITRTKTLQWIYAYLITDLLLLIRFLFIYIARTQSYSCSIDQLWFLFVCYVDAFVDNYLNILQVYIFLALNFCRYLQIVFNKNAYVLYKKWLVLVHLIIYFGPFIFLFVQFYIGWSEVVFLDHESCDVSYSTVPIQVFNISVLVILPIVLNVVLIILSCWYVHKTTKNRSQQHAQQLLAREKYNRALVVQFLGFYVIWLALWLPNIIVYQVSSGLITLTMYTRLLNYVEIALDPFIITVLDVRFRNVWKQIWKLFKKRINKIPLETRARIQPASLHRA